MERKPKKGLSFCAIKDIKGNVKYIYCDDTNNKEFYLGGGAFGKVFKGFRFIKELKNKKGPAYAIKRIPN